MRDMQAMTCKQQHMYNLSCDDMWVNDIWSIVRRHASNDM